VVGRYGFREAGDPWPDGGDLGMELIEGRLKRAVIVDEMECRLAVEEAGRFSDVREGHISRYFN